MPSEAPKFLIDHLEGCKPTAPCKSCKAHALLRQKLPNGAYEDFLRLLEDATGTVVNREKREQMDMQMPWDKAISLSGRIANGLKNDNILTLGDLVQKSPAELIRGRNFGRKSLKEIEEALAKIGLRLNMYIPSKEAPNCS